MASSRRTARAAAGVALALVVASCASARPAGAAAGPATLALVAADGSVTSLDEVRRGQDATVLVFWSASCPCVRRYQDRVDALLDAFPASRVRVLGVSSNAGESLVEVLRVARERRVRIPIVRDEQGRLAEALGVRSTPTAVVLDASGALRYRGWIDNERLPGDPRREPWLERALHGVLDGVGAFAARRPTYGCTITRSLFGPERASCCESR